MKGKIITLIGTALTLALSSTVAVGQSTKFPNRDFPEREEPTSVSESDDSIVAAAEDFFERKIVSLISLFLFIFYNLF